VLAGVAGAEEARTAPGVAAVTVRRGAGAVVAPLRRASDRAVSILALGDSAAEARGRAEAAAALLRFELLDVAALV
jgi:hypothetical protein